MALIWAHLAFDVAWVFSAAIRYFRRSVNNFRYTLCRYIFDNNYSHHVIISLSIQTISLLIVSSYFISLLLVVNNYQFIYVYYGAFYFTPLFSHISFHICLHFQQIASRFRFRSPPLSSYCFLRRADTQFLFISILHALFLSIRSLAFHSSRAYTFTDIFFFTFLFLFYYIKYFRALGLYVVSSRIALHFQHSIHFDNTISLSLFLFLVQPVIVLCLCIFSFT